MEADEEPVRDVLGDPDALTRAAGVTDPAAVQAAQRAHARMGVAEQALRQACADRSQAVRAAAAANPGLRPGTLARMLGVSATTVRAVLR